MDLKTFVTETLVSIVEGVKDAQPRVKEAGGSVNPNLLPARVAQHLMEHRVFLAGKGGIAQFMEFDVAITAAEGSGKKGGVGVVAPSSRPGGKPSPLASGRRRAG